MPRLFMFDAYGTLFDVHSAVRQNQNSVGPDFEAFSALWRAKQLEYTWIYSAMAINPLPNFKAVTEMALDFAMAKFGFNAAVLRADLLNSFDRLDPFADSIAALQELRIAGNRIAIFSNGTTLMLETMLSNAGMTALIDYVISVETITRYKPDPAVYAFALQAVGSPANPLEVVFVSSNRWDVAGAASFGFTPIWCNRTGQPGEYPGLGPIATITSLAELGEV